MTKSYPEMTQRLNKGLRELRVGAPESMKSFSSLAATATRDGTLDKKTKELIALAIGVSTRCDGCIGFHTKALVNLGVTKQEFQETLEMAVYMGGGPSLMYASDAMLAFNQFSEIKGDR